MDLRDSKWGTHESPMQNDGNYGENPWKNDGKPLKNMGKRWKHHEIHGKRGVKCMDQWIGLRDN